MPAGQLYIQYDSSWTGITTANRYNYSNGTFTRSNSGAWVDVFKQWGISFDKSALSTLWTPPPMKDWPDNRSRLENGTRKITSAPRYDERTITVGINMWATTEAAFLTNYASFCKNVLAKGKLNLMSSFQPGTVYRTLYVSCQNFGEYSRQLAKFSLRLVEPNPANRAI